MLSVHKSSNSQSRQLSPLPRRTDSLSSSVAKPKATSPIARSREDLKIARVVLEASVPSDNDAQVDDDHHNRERELREMLGRMANWVDELANLLQQAYKNQTDLETALTLTRSNLQLALANNEMLEEALQRGGEKDVGWRRWSDREDIRRSSTIRDYTQERPNSVEGVLPAHPRQAQSQQQQSGPSRFFNFMSPLQRVSSSGMSPISTQSSPHSDYSTNTFDVPVSSSHASSSFPPSRSSTPAPSQNGAVYDPPRAMTPPPPSAREQALTAQLSKERAAFETLSKEKLKLENELEGLSQALFEEANKMVSTANRKLAETEEELRIATEQREALRGALRIVEGENGQLRGRSPIPDSASNGGIDVGTTDVPRIVVPTEAHPTASSSRVETQESFWSPITPSSVSMGSPSPITQPSPAPTLSNENEHRWSIMPRTPRSRMAARDQFEQAIRRMNAFVDEEEEHAVHHSPQSTPSLLEPRKEHGADIPPVPSQ